MKILDLASGEAALTGKRAVGSVVFLWLLGHRVRKSVVPCRLRRPRAHLLTGSIHTLNHRTCLKNTETQLTCKKRKEDFWWDNVLISSQ